MQLTKGYFVISRLVHRLGRAQSYREGGGQEEACRQQEGCGLQPPPNPAIFYTPLPWLPKEPAEARHQQRHACDGYLWQRHHTVALSPAPLHSFMKHFFWTQVRCTALSCVLRGCTKAVGEAQSERTRLACAKGWVFYPED